MDGAACSSCPTKKLREAALARATRLSAIGKNSMRLTTRTVPVGTIPSQVFSRRRWHVSCTTSGHMRHQNNGSAVRARLVRHLPMRLLDVSLSGCLVESRAEIPNGVNGTLNVDLWGVPCRFPVRLAREAGRDQDKPLFRLGAEFSWPSRNQPRSIAQLMCPQTSRGPARVLPFARP